MSIKFDLGEYLTDVFVETGTGRGGNIIKAIRAGFADIHGIETSPDFHTQTHEQVGQEMGRFPSRSNIMLYCGPSTAGLEQVCSVVHHKRATFLLGGRDEQATQPRLEEIGIIRRWFQDALIPPIIMVAGVRHGVPPLGAVLDALLDLNDEYQFRFLDDAVRRNVLVALPPSWTHA